MKPAKSQRFTTRVVHAGVSNEHQEAAGITDDLIRLSVGCEAWEDIRDDLAKAMEKAG